MNSRTITIVFILLLISFCPFQNLMAQNSPDPRGAFLRSLVLPGWGHYYVERDIWGRGAVHLGAELTLIASYAGLKVRSSNKLEQYTTLASLRAGVDISGRIRSFQLAIADFNSLAEYNDFQLRSRNWNQLIDDVPENRWDWTSAEDRERYNELRGDRETANNQIPAVAAMMVLNRVFSAVNAYSRARNISGVPEVALTPVKSAENSGFVATFRFRY
jgi:hypothetical protein